MFALEIIFKDGISQPEMILVRRLQAIIGASDYAHVVVDDLKSLDIQLRLTREAGRRFRCKPIGGGAGSPGKELSSLLEGVFQGEAQMDLGPVKFQFSALDSDLLLREGESPDRAGVRILRQASSRPSPLYPAVAVAGAQPMVISFVPDQPIYIGRAKQCILRLDSADISAKHARLGFESGEFWVEDLGSTNGTFVNGQQISGRSSVPPGVPIVLGREITLFGVTNAAQLEQVTRSGSQAPSSSLRQERKYPVLVSASEVARPARLVLVPGITVSIGRDPASELWLGAPHVSRRHCSVTMTPTGEILVNDHSTNGTSYDRGILRRGDALEVGDRPCVLDFGGGVSVGLCFNEEEEERFIGTQGAPNTFTSGDGESDPERQEELRPGAPNSRPGSAISWGAASNSESSSMSRFFRFYRSLRPTGKASILLFGFMAGLVAVIVISVLSGF